MKKQIPDKIKPLIEYTPTKIDYSFQKSISFSQWSQYLTCKHRWALNYIHNLQEYTPSIHTVFGTALHETVQTWLEVLYQSTAKAAGELDLEELLLQQMKEVYSKERQKVNSSDFSSSQELREFYQDGVDILRHLKSNRGIYFPKKNTYLIGVEFPIVYKLRTNVYFKGYIDLLFYDSVLDKFKIIDLKTSTSGWSEYEKKDEIKLTQLLLYKYFLSEMFNIPLESIDVEYKIVRRKINEDLEFIPKRVQKVIPSSGKIKIGKIKKMLTEFLDEAFTEDGQYVNKIYSANPSKSSCRFCTFNNNLELCPESYKKIDSF
jgi:CRISPR/Cas system-associated exonuclease Cas4 (RecB family)